MALTEGYLLGAVEAWRRGSPGVSDQGMHTSGSAQEPGRTLKVSAMESRVGSG